MLILFGMINMGDLPEYMVNPALINELKRENSSANFTTKMILHGLLEAISMKSFGIMRSREDLLESNV